MDDGCYRWLYTRVVVHIYEELVIDAGGVAVLIRFHEFGSANRLRRVHRASYVLMDLRDGIVSL
ncbi:MAG: hypothetical protein ACQSGP_00045, partial [Frankia sp.]